MEFRKKKTSDILCDVLCLYLFYYSKAVDIWFLELQAQLQCKDKNGKIIKEHDSKLLNGFKKPATDDNCLKNAVEQCKTENQGIQGYVNKTTDKYFFK